MKELLKTYWIVGGVLSAFNTLIFLTAGLYEYIHGNRTDGIALLIFWGCLLAGILVLLPIIYHHHQRSKKHRSFKEGRTL